MFIIDVQIGGCYQIEHSALANPMREALKMIDGFMQETMTSPFQKGIYRQQQLAECYWSSRSAASYGPSFFYIATIVANTEENCVPQTF